MTVGRGANFILNIPPDTTGINSLILNTKLKGILSVVGVIPDYFTVETKKFGDALQATFSTPLASMSVCPDIN